MVGVLKLIVSELSYAQVDFKSGELPDGEVIRVLMKEAKKRKDSIEIYTKVDSPERAEEEKYELGVIEGYLPQMMSEDEVVAEVSKISNETGLTGGKLMGAVMGKLRGKADGSVVQKVVSEKFS
ncbi:MAG: hypothetical protein UX47_C0006G0073 [Candidatus Collierbacteria bacterium GW2011_GWA2_46_26]|uniref:Glutamyl-tRNA amidotransferase n=1 Tax=Candidatus Collierbacteria bacterium GW2011_GWA2_46_26 TaxID=1618381 RepID=A0A0G1PKA3_9BACT|nr:MAG: hypothetical protein UW29_C0005G0064 [Candidatus Collierbacteria bacterium GW2011_GWC2_44_13]KKU33102.1 MAG: hypothetical protein UX47_C0006G0073 [Candidatus Collierbacteria bacterium GW2011_GWA2_46_26]